MLHKILFIGAVALPLVSSSQSILRDTTAMSEILISENRLQIPFEKTGRNIQILTKKDLQQLSIKSVNEALSYLGGVDVRQRGPFGTQTDIGIDGGSFEQTLILLNGVKISDVQTAHHSMNIPVPLDAVERIEVLRGPAARVYGINALTGAINIVTKLQDRNYFSIHTQVGSSFDEKEQGDGHGVYAGGSLQLIANLGNQNLQNLLSISQDATNGQRYNTAAKNRKAFYQGNANLNEKNTFNWMVGTIHNAFGANAYYAAPYDKEAEEIVNTALVSVGSLHRLGTKFTLKPRVSYRYNEDDFRLYKNDLSKSRSEHSTDVLSAELNSTLNTAYGDFGFGLESRSEKIESTNIGEHERYNHGAYVEYSTDTIEKIFLQVGTYVNYNTQYGWQVFPGLDVAYEFAPAWKFAFNVGSSQRLPSFTDLYLQQAPSNVGNPALKSENAWQYEASLHYNLSNVTFQAGYFYRNIDDYIDWIRPVSQTPVPYQPQNFGDNKIQGLNVSVQQYLQLSDRSVLSYQVRYNYLAPKELSYGAGTTSKYTLESLKHQATVLLGYIYHQWSISSGNRLVKRELKNSYFISDLRLGYQGNAWRIYGDITNLANQSYIETAAVPLPGRWGSVGFQYVLR